MPPRLKCAATTCEAMIPRGMLMCHDDWQRVPKPIRAEIYRTRSHGTSSRNYLAKVKEAVQAVDALRVGRDEVVG